MNEFLERLAKAIEDAGQDRIYGLYDYSMYPGDSPPHQVRDEKTGKVLLFASNHNEAYDYWKKLSREYIVKAVLKAMREPTEVMIADGEAILFEHLPEAKDWTMTLMKEAFQAMIDAAMQDEKV